MRIKTVKGIEGQKLEIVMNYLPEVEERLDYVFPGYSIRKIEILDTAVACGTYVKMTCENGKDFVTIERQVDIWYECGLVHRDGLLKDPEERKKYLEGAYIFKDFPFGTLGEGYIEFY